MAERPGVFIEKGPQNFEIIQRNCDGHADIALSGKWIGTADTNDAAVYVRLLMEDSGQEVISYTKCEMSGSEWSVLLQNIPAGGLYKIETGLQLNGNPRLDWNLAGEMRHFIGIGDVYVIAGQSNSAGYGKGIAEDAPELGVHALKYDGCWTVASHPLGDCTNAVHHASLEDSNHGNSPYIRFAKILSNQLHIPIGLVPAALGGSPLSSWNLEEDGYLYRNMQEITANLLNGYKGVLWYQGCGDTDFQETAESYGERFQKMVDRWRSDCQKPELIFLTCQLNRYRAGADRESNRRWGMVREAQRQAARNISNCFVVPTVDIPMSDAIHNSAAGNIMLGERLAWLALSEVYHAVPPFTAASLRKAYKKGCDSIGLEFDGLCGMLDGFTDDMKKLDIVISDENGTNGIKGCYFGINDIFIQLERELVGRCVITCGSGKDIERIIPIDCGTFMPILCFFEVEVEK